jgi:hypothetical protein
VLITDVCQRLEIGVVAHATAAGATDEEVHPRVRNVSHIPGIHGNLDFRQMSCNECEQILRDEFTEGVDAKGSIEMRAARRPLPIPRRCAFTELMESRHVPIRGGGIVN